MGSIFRHRHAPGKAADRDRLDRFELLDVDHRDVVADAVGGEQQLFVRRKGQLPDTLADQNTLLDLEFAYLKSANLAGANLMGAELGGANLSGSVLSGADLTNADIQDARFLEVEGIDAIFGLDTTRNRGSALFD